MNATIPKTGNGRGEDGLGWTSDETDGSDDETSNESGPDNGGERLGQIRTERVSVVTLPPRQTCSKSNQSKSVSSERLAQKVSQKMEVGDFRGAVRLVGSSETFADSNDSTMELLLSKHPAPPVDALPPPPVDSDCQFSSSFTTLDISRAIGSFSSGSAEGPDGLTPLHLKDLTSTSAGDGGRELLNALTLFANFLAVSRPIPEINPIFLGASLSAFKKGDGGVRPIAVGFTLRRLVAKCLCCKVQREMTELLSPLQLGFRISGGMEAAIHAARLFIAESSPTSCLLKVDFKNAFNTLRRDRMLQSVKTSVPMLLPFVLNSYGGSIVLVL